MNVTLCKLLQECSEGTDFERKTEGLRKERSIQKNCTKLVLMTQITTMVWSLT